jgi:ethanolamine utilization protein EutQ (cupin superfamily)
MPTHISQPTAIEATSDKPRFAREFVGRINSAFNRLSIARMRSRPGWAEPGPTPDFDEYALVLKSTLSVSTKNQAVDVESGQAVFTHRGEWIQCSTPGVRDAEYIAVCLPAVSAETVHRSVEEAA